MASVHLSYTKEQLQDKVDFDISKVLDLQALQEMMDEFFKVTKIGFSLIDLNGNVLVGTGWQDICVDFHRKNPQTLKNCLESDLELTKGVKEGEYRVYKCKNGLIDTVTPLFIGGMHVANIVSGQFFFKGEGDDIDKFAAHAEKYGFDKEAYICAFKNVPRWDKGQVDALLVFYTKLTHMLSKKGQANLRLSQLLDEKAKVKKELEMSQADLKRAQAVGKIGNWRVLVDGGLFWSDETYRIFGIPKGTKLTYDVFIEAVYPEDRKYVDCEWQAALRGKPYDIEHRIVANGRIVWVREKAELEFKDGNLLGGFGTVQDITKRKQVQLRLQEKTAELESTQKKLEENAVSIEAYAHQMGHLADERLEKLKQAERLAVIGQTAGMVGHDIRNPLQAMISDVYLLKDELSLMPQCKTKEGVVESLDSIEANIGYINKIVADLQDYARPLKPQYVDINLYELVTNLFRNIVLPGNIDCSIDIAPSFELKSDDTLVKRILTNIIINAIQAMPNGGKLTIKGCLTDEAVLVVVRDSGVGIPEHVKPKLFTPMLTTKSKGQGLGLAVVKRLVEALNGAISFESQEGKGTEFTIQLRR